MEGICSVILVAWQESFAREPEHITMRQKIYSRFSVRKFRKETGATYYETKDLPTFQVKDSDTYISPSVLGLLFLLFLCPCLSNFWSH